jgi:hypothetical protein
LFSGKVGNYSGPRWGFPLALDRISYSAVVKIKERFARETEENKKLRKMTGNIDMELSNVKG